MTRIVIILLSALTGYISLSQEILWVKLISFATGSAPETFGEVLGFFLLGIAFGSLIGKQVSTKHSKKIKEYLGGVILVSAIIYYISIPVISLFTEAGFGIEVSYLLIFIIALLQGGIFTTLCFIGIKEGENVGIGVSRIYMANIVGSIAGPLITGFVMLDLFTIEQNVLIITYIALLLSFVVLMYSSIRRMYKYALLSLIVFSGFSFNSIHSSFYNRTLEKLQGLNGENFKHSFQGRHGIITVSEEAHGDIIYGNGMYDGRFNVGPESNSNGIDRAYLVASLHRRPKDVLQIGLGSGSWTKVLADYENIESLTVIEINPGYAEAVSMYPEHGEILSNPKVKLVIDDGRRWLKRNPDKKFDMIIMNTTWNWRSFSTSLLSIDFLESVKEHLNNDGVIYYNTTGSHDVVITAAHVFKHIVKYSNVIAAGDNPFNLDDATKNINYLKFFRNGKPVLEYKSNDEIDIKRLMHVPLVDIGETVRKQYEEYPLITDDNLLTEYKSSVRPVGIGQIISSDRVQQSEAVYDHRKSWFRLFDKLF